MASHEGSHGNKDVDVDVRELFNLLDSANIADVTEIKELVQEKLASTDDKWILNSLVEYYYITSSKEAIDILTKVKDPHDKHLIDKLSEGIRGSQNKLKALQLLLHVVCKQPTWIHNITQSVFGALVKCLKNETDVPILMTGVMTLTILLPTIPTYLGNHLHTIFEIFTHLVSFSYKKPDLLLGIRPRRLISHVSSYQPKNRVGNVPDVYLLHLQVSLYSLFHRLYGMFPYNFVGYLRNFYGSKKENIAVYEELVKPMLERVRLHPGLITGSRDTEVSSSRWRSMEVQDIVMECAKVSLDVMEGIDGTNKDVFHRPLEQGARRNGHVRAIKDSSFLRLPENVSSSGIQQEFFSPSMVIGMSTPPPSQRNTPATSVLELSSATHGQSASTTHGNTPVLTPRATPPISDEQEKGMSRNSSRGSLFTNKSVDRRSITLVTKSQPTSDSKSSVPPSPMKTEFTTEPPLGTFRSQPVRTTARELKFDIINNPVPESPMPSFSDSVMLYPGAESAEKNEGIDNVMKTESVDKDEVSKQTGQREDSLERKDSIERPDLMESFSMDTLPKMMEALHDSDDDDEVSEITQNHQAVNSHLTAESVAQFMKSVNRIRFNSLTATNTMDLYKDKGSTRSRSCPKLTSMEDEEESVGSEGEMSRSVSIATEIQEQSHSSQNSQVTAVPVVTTVAIDTKTVTMTTSNISITSCPVFIQSVNSQDNQPPQTSLMDVLKTTLLPNSMHLCQKCKSCMLSGKDDDREVPLYQSLSPLELLDKHLTMGREIHAKELSKIPITSQESISWTHFGGAPPADEINILRGQIIMMENQLMYERHKRELHNKRNRRLLRKIANAETLEENNNVMAEQIQILETEIQNFKITTKLLQDENRKLKDLQESNEYETQVKLRTALQENSDLKSTKTELNTLLVRQREEQDALKKKLQDADSQLFHGKQEIIHLKEQAELAQKLKDQMLQTHKELMLMGELQQKYQENININKYRDNKQPEHEMLVATLKAEIKVLQAQWDRDSLQLTACQQRIIELEESIKNKDGCIVELKKRLEDVKVSQEDEIKAVEEKYKTVIKINQGLEGNILKLYSQIDELKQQRHRRVQKAESSQSSPIQAVPIHSDVKGQGPGQIPDGATGSMTSNSVESTGNPTSCVSNSLDYSQQPLTPSQTDVNQSDAVSEMSEQTVTDIDGNSMMSRESGIET